MNSRVTRLAFQAYDLLRRLRASSLVQTSHFIGPGTDNFVFRIAPLASLRHEVTFCRYHDLLYLSYFSFGYRPERRENLTSAILDLTPGVVALHSFCYPAPLPSAYRVYHDISLGSQRRLGALSFPALAYHHLPRHLHRAKIVPDDPGSGQNKTFVLTLLAWLAPPHTQWLRRQS